MSHSKKFNLYPKQLTNRDHVPDVIKAIRILAKWSLQSRVRASFPLASVHITTLVRGAIQQPEEIEQTLRNAPLWLWLEPRRPRRLARAKLLGDERSNT